jgi:hypothetical protein
MTALFVLCLSSSIPTQEDPFMMLNRYFAAVIALSGRHFCLGRQRDIEGKKRGD